MVRLIADKQRLNLREYELVSLLRNIEFCMHYLKLHITQGDHVGEGVIVSWITPNEPGSSTLLYWSEKSHLNYSAQGVFITYSYFNYTSGYLHHCTIDDLELDTNFYQVGIGNTTRKFWFITLPGLGPDVPYTFGIIGNHT
ncbi:hypothetical protein CsatA_019600 [Cannabis sativa]